MNANFLSTAYFKKEPRFTWVLNLHCGVGIEMRGVNYLCAHLLCQDLGEVERHPSHTWHTKTRYSRGETICYLIQSIVSCHGHSVGVQHELLSQKSKEAVCVHDLHLPPVDAPTYTLWLSDLFRDL